MKCLRLAYIKKELPKLTFRKFESKYHESFWKDYENVLMVRTYMLALSRTLLWIFTLAVVESPSDRYEQFVEQKGESARNEEAQAIFPYANTILDVLHVTRLLISIFSLKWPKLLKGYFYVEMLILMTVTFLPDDMSLEH